MHNHPEFRVRPVIRHVVTRYTPIEPSPDGTKWADGPRGGLETLGEFDSEGYADIVAEALRERVAPREYVLVQVSLGEVMTQVFYAYGELDAQRLLAEKQADGSAWRVYHRLQPVA